MSTFDIKKFLINEGLTRVSRDRQRLRENKTKLNEDWNDDDEDEIAPGFKIPKRWKGLDGKFQMPAGDMSVLAGTGGIVPKEMIGKESEKAAWNAIKNWDMAEFFEFHGMVDEELKDWCRENTANEDIDSNWWHCDFSKGSDRATGKYVGFTSDDFMGLEEPATEAGWFKETPTYFYVGEPKTDKEREGDRNSEIMDDFIGVLEETADIIVEVGGKDWALVWYLKKLDTLNEARKLTTTKKQGTVRQGNVKASPNTKVKKKTTGNGGRKFEEFDKKEFEKSPEGQPKVVKDK